MSNHQNRGYDSSHLAALAAIRDELEQARQVLADIYRRRTAATIAARAAGLSRREVADALGVVPEALYKIVTGQDGLPARKGVSWRERAYYERTGTWPTGRLAEAIRAGWDESRWPKQ